MAPAYHLTALLSAAVVLAQPQGWHVDEIAEGVVMVYNDAGNWGGPSMGTSHQNSPNYQTRKTIDLSCVPEPLFRQLKAVRLRVFFALQDYSWALPTVPNNGLDEQFEVVVNGRAFRYATAAGFGGRASSAQRMHWRWTDFPVPADAIRRGPNEIVFRKVPHDRKRRLDDYIYVGIDNTVQFGTSALSMDGGKSWTTDRLNAIDARGEYMVRMVLMTRDLSTRAAWRPARGNEKGPDVLDDPASAVGFREWNRGHWKPDGLHLAPGGTAALWLDRESLDSLTPVRLLIAYSGQPPQVTFLDDSGSELAAAAKGSDETLEATITAPRQTPRRALIKAPAEGPLVLHQVTLIAARHYLPPPVIDMCPPVAALPARPAAGPPRCSKREASVELGDRLLLARFSTDRGLSLQALRTGHTPRPLLEAKSSAAGRPPFVLEVSGKRILSSELKVTGVQLGGDDEQPEASFQLEGRRIAATFTARALGSGRIRFGLSLQNRTSRPLPVKVAFPLLAGIAADYYLFPYCGGIIADVPTYLRTAYGENTAWWQMIDVFRPSEGFGLYVRVEDEAGVHKCPVLRKGRQFRPGYTIDQAGRYLPPEWMWEDSLQPSDGISLTFEHVQRTLNPGQQWRLPPATIAVHEGDWHNAMADYSAWAHRVWEWRPYPGPLADWWNVTPVGWGQRPLCDKNGWRKDYLEENTGVAEMMSWWEWSDLGPWRVPMKHDTLRKKLGEAFYKRYRSYWVVDPIAGRLRYPLNRGDYRYNETWGGLEAFRRHIAEVRRRGAMPGVYIDGILACDTTDVGHKWGPQYGAINPFWKDHYKCPLNPPGGYVAAYGSWNMCCDTEWWADYLSRTVARIFRDTGIDYLRIDEFGHRGYPCWSDKHKHMFSPERGHNAWLQGCAEICRRAHALMDKIRPNLALTTEFPGNDHMAAYLDGSIVYEVGHHVWPIRPVVCNLFRFYFPECKPMDLDRRTGGQGLKMKLWNGMMAFAPRYPLRYLRLLRMHSDAFGRGQATPLVHTLQARVYANRYVARGKTIIVLLNARPYPVDGPLLAVQPRKDRHFVELLRGLELRPAETARGLALALRLEPEDIAVIADLPRLLAARREADRVQVTVRRPQPGDVLALLGPDNEIIARRPAQPSTTLDVPRDITSAGLMAALLRGRYIVDVVPAAQ